MFFRKAKKRTKTSRTRLGGESLENRNLMTGIGVGADLEVPNEGVFFPEVEIHLCSTITSIDETNTDDEGENREDRNQAEKAMIFVRIPGVGGDSTIDG